MHRIVSQQWQKKGARRRHEGGETGVVLADHCKAFDGIDHNLLTAKLNAYGFKENP